MRPIAKFRALSAADRALLLGSLAPLAAMRIALWTLPFGQVRRLAESMSGGAGSLSSGSAETRPPREKIAWAVATASRLVPGGINCLVRALATGIVLRRHGYASTLKIGVTKPADGGFAAHAWLESDGMVVIGDFQLDRYVQMGVQNSPSPR